MISSVGVVLAGGLSRRMDGPEKSLLKLGDKTLIARVCERLAAQTAQVIINANGDPERFADIHLPVVADTIEGFAGPLAGVLTGMRWVKEHTKATHIITVAADTPFFPADYVSTIEEIAANNSTEIALAASNGNRHPVFGLWPVNLADALEAFLVQEKQRKVMLFVQRHPNCLIEFSGVNPDPFFNINTPDDLRIAQELIGETA